MCYSKAEGGQRCYGHARDTYVRAYGAYMTASTGQDVFGPVPPASRAEIDHAYEKLRTAQDEFASTPKGEAELRTLITQHETDPAWTGRLDDIRESLQRGIALRHRNAAIRAACKAAAKSHEPPPVLVEPSADEPPFPDPERPEPASDEWFEDLLCAECGRYPAETRDGYCFGCEARLAREHAEDEAYTRHLWNTR